MTKYDVFYTVSIGTIAGFVIGIYFKVIESIWVVQVYTLLLNIDYFPLFKTIPFPEWIEFSFHLIVSIVLAVLLKFITNHFAWNNGLLKITLISVLIGLLLYPTTAFSNRTPELGSFPALSHWIAGHMLFGLVLGFFMQQQSKKQNDA